MSLKPRLLVLTVTTFAGAVLLGAGTVAAATTSVTISAPGAASGTRLALTGTGRTNLIIKSLRASSPPGIPVTCTSGSNPSSFGGTTTAGAFSGSAAGQARAQIATLSLRNCIFGGSAVVTNRPLAAPWYVDVTGPTVSGKTPVTLRNVSLSLNAGTCTFTLGGRGGVPLGSFDAYIENGTSPALTLSSATAATTNLVIRSYTSTASNGLCFAGAFQVGDPFTLAGSLSLKVTNNGQAADPLSVVAR